MRFSASIVCVALAAVSSVCARSHASRSLADVNSILDTAHSALVDVKADVTAVLALAGSVSDKVLAKKLSPVLAEVVAIVQSELADPLAALNSTGIVRRGVTTSTVSASTTKTLTALASILNAVEATTVKLPIAGAVLTQAYATLNPPLSSALGSLNSLVSGLAGTIDQLIEDLHLAPLLTNLVGGVKGTVNGLLGGLGSTIGSIGV